VRKRLGSARKIFVDNRTRQCRAIDLEQDQIRTPGKVPGRCSFNLVTVRTVDEAVAGVRRGSVVLPARPRRLEFVACRDVKEPEVHDGLKADLKVGLYEARKLVGC
jgi:hypothetical protein